MSLEELEIVNKIFDSSKYNEYYSTRIESILNNNDNIDNKDFVITFLSFLDKIIPDGSKTNFYRNLESMKDKLNLDEKTLISLSSTTLLLEAAAPNKYNKFS